MPVNPYFNNFKSSMEQTLIEDLIVESIKVYGFDVQYCPCTVMAKDELYGADTVSEYNSSTDIEMYIKSVDGFEGDGVFLSKFGLEMRDQIVLTVSLRSFANEILHISEQEKPREGDLIYFTLNPNRPQLYVVKYVNDRSIFYQLGGMQVYDLTCELFEYSGEQLNTGIPEIDALEAKLTTNMSAFGILTHAGKNIVTSAGYSIVRSEFKLDTQLQDAGDDSEYFQANASGIIDFSDVDPFSEGVF
jgi:hypothetical protein